ncbi:hypothetical protein D3Z48_19210, partial [Clostridiaceae bacterium]|nr:hypothetical protein [Clostridiaceae bacterium]
GGALPLHPAPTRRAAGLCPCTPRLRGERRGSAPAPRDFFVKKSSKNFITPAGGNAFALPLMSIHGLGVFESQEKIL